MSGSDAARSRQHPSALGLAYGVAAYGLWGFMPLYLKAVRAVPVLEVLCHRVVWALALLLPLVWRRGELGALLAAMRRRRPLAILTASTFAIAMNWLVYIWAVVHERVLEASLGYYINPLVNVLLGVVVLGERLDRPVRIAVASAAAGVGWLTIRLGQPPWIALALAASSGPP
jgi:chloramphenicol-sensitive protein RarD